MSHYECKGCFRPLMYCECPIVQDATLAEVAKQVVDQRKKIDNFAEVYDRPTLSLEGCECETCQPDPAAQVGGTHYGTGVDCFQFSLERKHDCLQHAAIKYIDRHHLKNGRQDIEKAMSVLQRILKEQYAD